jgi:hypothetical protein
MTKEEYAEMCKIMGVIMYTLKWHRPDMPHAWHVAETERMYCAWRVWDHEYADKALHERPYPGDRNLYEDS